MIPWGVIVLADFVLLAGVHCPKSNIEKRNVSPVLKKCFSTPNFLSGKGKPVLINTNFSFAVFLSLCIKIFFTFSFCLLGVGENILSLNTNVSLLCFSFHAHETFFTLSFSGWGGGGGGGGVGARATIALAIFHLFLWHSTNILSYRPDIPSSIPALRTLIGG